MSEIQWQDFLNILTLKGADTGALKQVRCDDRFSICLEANKCYLEEWLTNRVKREVKSGSKSVEFRVNGNQVYQRGNDLEALKLYNLSAIFAPYHSNEFSLALSNRSAVLVRLGFCNEALHDVNLALVHGDETIPQKKLLTRKALLLHKLNFFQESLQLIKSLFPDENEIYTHNNKELKEAYSDNLLKTSQAISTNQEEPKIFLPTPKDGENKSFPSASVRASLKFSNEKGRHVIANERFNKGDIVFVEKPFALVVLPEQYYKHCHHCCKEIISCLPCAECTRALFCGEACRTAAWLRYHQWECRGLEVCHCIGIAHLGLRVALMADSSEQYKQVYDLLTHTDNMPPEDLYQYTLTAVLLTLYLKNYTSYFETNTTVTVEEMGNRILRHVAQLVCNGHAITKIDAAETKEKYSKTFTEAQLRIATAIYPSVSMMNHSCDHNISNSFVNEYLIVRASRDIKKEEEIFNCYGPHYAHEDTEERQRKLQSQYFFKCECVRCRGCGSQQLQFSALLCSLCSGPVMSGQGQCAHCHRPQPLRQMVELALSAQQLHHHGKKLLKKGSLNESLSVLEECVQISSKCLYKHNSDLRIYKDCLARVRAELGQYDEAISLVEECIKSVEEQFGDGVELSRELVKLDDLLQSDLTRLREAGLQGSQQFRDKLEKLRRRKEQARKLLPGTTDSENYCGSIQNTAEDLKNFEL